MNDYNYDPAKHIGFNTQESIGINFAVFLTIIMIKRIKLDIIAVI